MCEHLWRVACDAGGQDLNNHESALRSLARALKVMPMHHEARLSYCHLLYTLNNIEGCLHCFNELVLMHPKSARAFTAAGMVYQELGEYDAAQLFYRAALDISPGHLVAGTRYAAMAGMRNFQLGTEYLQDLFSSYTLMNDEIAVR